MLILLKNLSRTKMNSEKHHQTGPLSPRKSRVGHFRAKDFLVFLIQLAQLRKMRGFSAESNVET
jgi:hypothetical protein